GIRSHISTGGLDRIARAFPPVEDRGTRLERRLQPGSGAFLVAGIVHLRAHRPRAAVNYQPPPSLRHDRAIATGLQGHQLPGPRSTMVAPEPLLVFAAGAGAGRIATPTNRRTDRAAG